MVTDFDIIVSIDPENLFNYISFFFNVNAV